MLDINKEKNKEETEALFTDIESDDIVKFHNDVILGEGTFKKTYKIGKNIQVIFRTRMGIERNTIQERLSADPKNGLDMIRLQGDYNLAFSLVSFGEKNYDKGTFEERLDILYKMPAPKLNILWDYQIKFDEYINKLVTATVNF